tara:strand:+ start:5048 stop:5644 length:597 start_codon:yes stop_codon:yes gene_type:complete
MTTKLNVYQKVNKVMSELSYLKKTSQVGSGNYGYTALSHDHVTSSIQPLMVKYGLVAETSMIDEVFLKYEVKTRKGDIQDRYDVKCAASVTIVNADEPSERFTVKASAQGFDPQDKASGKAYSMAVKYCLLKLFMVASGDDEESRVEEAKAVTNINDELKIELTKLLKANGKFTPQFVSIINSMDYDSLITKIEENKQ